MGIRYQYKKIKQEADEILAVFDKGDPSFLRIFDKENLFSFSEKDCADLYHETKDSNAKASSSLADPRYQDDIRRGFSEIRKRKKSLGIPLDIDNLESYSRFG